MTMFIYGLADPRDGRVHYVGQTDTMKVRLSGHRSMKESDIRKSPKHAWVFGLAGLGLRPDMIEIDVLAPSANPDVEEAFWIGVYRGEGHPILNIRKGGKTGAKMFVVTKEEIEDLRNGRRIRVPPGSRTRSRAHRK